MIVGLFTDLIANGGIPRVSRHVCVVLKEMAAREKQQLRLLSLNDTQGIHEVYAVNTSFSIRGFGRDKRKFALTAMREGRRARLIYIAHPNLAPLGFFCKLARPSLKCIVSTHGAEVWTTMNLLRRFSLRRADVVVAPSQFTALKLEE